MAYVTKWTISFKDFNDTLHVVNIQEDGFSGTATALTPGDTPIIWDEDNNDDLSKPVRGKTGHIEVVEENYGDLADIFPTAPMQYRVVCDGVFFGYIKAETGTNPWEAGPRTLKLNILSPLAIAYNVPMPINTTLGMREVGEVMADIMTTLGYSYVYMPKGNVDDLGEFFAGQVRGYLICPYANDKDYHYANDSEIFDPISVGDFIEAVCLKHEMMAHDAVDGYSASLIFSRFADTNGIYRWTFANISNGNYTIADEILTPYADEHEFMEDFPTASNDNNETLIRPYSNIDILLGGERGESVHFPTVQSQYIPSSDQYNLTPRGIWLTNKNGNVKLGNIDLVDNDNLVGYDTLYFNTTLQPGATLFSITFYNIDRFKQYRLKFKYAHTRDGGSDALKISARGKGGWYSGSGGSADTPIWPNENKILFTLSGETSGIPTIEYEKVTNLYFIPDDYITVNFYVADNGNALTNLYITDIELEALDFELTPSEPGDPVFSRWAETRFDQRLTGNAGSDNMSLTLVLNNRFFSNYYVTDYEFFVNGMNYLLRSRKRVQMTTRGETLSNLWYLYRYIMTDIYETWRIIAVSYDVCKNNYKLTIQQIS